MTRVAGECCAAVVALTLGSTRADLETHPASGTAVRASPPNQRESLRSLRPRGGNEQMPWRSVLRAPAIFMAATTRGVGSCLVRGAEVRVDRIADPCGLGRPEAVRVVGRGEPLVGEVDLLLSVLGEVGDRLALVAAPVDCLVGLGVDDVRVDGSQRGDVLRLRPRIRLGRNPPPLGCLGGGRRAARGLRRGCSAWRGGGRCLSRGLVGALVAAAGGQRSGDGYGRECGSGGAVVDDSPL